MGVITNQECEAMQWTVQSLVLSLNLAPHQECHLLQTERQDGTRQLREAVR